MSYYVYEVYYCGILVYIGQGQGRRLNHVCSGSSHNNYLNEVYYRNKALNEPSAKVSIRRKFKTKKEATASERYQISRLTPLFNTYHANHRKAKLFSAEERVKLSGIGENFLAVVDVFEEMCFISNTNPKFSLTPLGTEMYGWISRIRDCSFDLAGLTMVGKCERIEEYFEWVFVGKGLVKVWLKPSIMKTVVDLLDSDYYAFSISQEPKGKPLIEYDDFRFRMFGSSPPDGYWQHKKQNLIQCRTIGLRSNVKLVVALYADNAGYTVVCENNGQVLYRSNVLAEALCIYSDSYLSGKDFVLSSDLSCRIEIETVVNFDPTTTKSGKTPKKKNFETCPLSERMVDDNVGVEFIDDQQPLPEIIWDGVLQD